MTPQNIVLYFEKKLDGKEYITPSDLIETGLFASNAAVRSAIDRGDFPAIRVSPHRLIIPAKAVLDHLYRGIEAIK